MPLRRNWLILLRRKRIQSLLILSSYRINMISFWVSTGAWKIAQFVQQTNKSSSLMARSRISRKTRRLLLTSTRIRDLERKKQLMIEPWKSVNKWSLKVKRWFRKFAKEDIKTSFKNMKSTSLMITITWGKSRNTKLSSSELEKKTRQKQLQITC